MNRKQKKALRQRQSTRQLMGIQRITEHGVSTPAGELTFFLIRPENLSVLSPEGVRTRVLALGNLFRALREVEILALDSRESFYRNKEFYRKRMEEETVPALRELLKRDMAHLDEIQSASASAREFVLVLRTDEKTAQDEGSPRQTEKALCDHGVHVHLAEEQDVKRLLAVYYQRDMTTDQFEDVDGERLVCGHG